jgi:outer membrane lipoprotein-sorting protein
MKVLALIGFFPAMLMFQTPDAETIMNRVDENMSSKNRVFTSKMIIHTRRGDRIVESRSWTRGDTENFTEYLSPAREKGTKMLKLHDQLWIYSPSTDRTIQISGHMLRQSVMGSDMSYEDMMEDTELREKYNAKLAGEEFIDGVECWVLALEAKDDSEVAYYKRKQWVDKQKYVPLKEELYAKGGKLLKTTILSDIVNINGRWFPTRVWFKDMLKSGEGTEFIITDIKFNTEIPEHVFSKAGLRRSPI